MSASIKDVLTRLDDVRPRCSGQWQALCPAHDDRNPSLSVTKGDDGRPLLHCFAGCTYPDIMAALGLSTNGNGVAAPAATKRPKATKTAATGRIVATYDYQDAAGRVLFQKVRYEPKSFSIRRPDGRGGYIWGLGDVAPVLYRLPELVDLATAGQPVYICEGEKDVDRVAGLGLVATCNFDGASAAGQRSNKWRPKYNEHFAGRMVYILADNDDAGQAHSENIAVNLHGIAQAVKVVDLPGLPPKGDVSDWLDLGHTKEKLERVCLTSPLWVAADSMKAPALSAVVRQASSFKLNDTGNAERFVAQHGDDVRYDHSSGRFLMWVGTHFGWDDNGEVQRRAKITVQAIYSEAAEAAKVGRDEEAAQLAKWARTSGQEARRNAMISLARSELPIAVTHDQLNRHELLLNVQNGTFDLATCQLRPHDRADLLTYVLPVPYDPAAVCPTWDNFIERSTAGDRTMADFLARAVGYTLSGSIAEQCLLFIYGLGANGKSTLTETIMALMGDLGHKARAQVFTKLKDEREGVPNEVAALAGKRLVVASEMADGGRLNEGLVKDMTGEDTISARFLYRELFHFKPTFKLWMYGNHKPVIVGTDDGIWRRVKLIPFTVQIPESERDPALPAKLRAELPGILAWAIRGWREYQRRGLDTPTAVGAATAEYRADSDTLGLFLGERCIMGASLWAIAGELYNAYVEWATANGLHPLSSVRFSKELVARGLTKDRKPGDGRYIYKGVGILGTL